MNRYVRRTASYSTYERLAPSYGPTMDRCIRRTASSMVEVPFTGTLRGGMDDTWLLDNNSQVHSLVNGTEDVVGSRDREGADGDAIAA